MANFMVCPLDLTVRQQHIFTLLYNRCSFKDNFRVDYTVQQLYVKSDKCFGLTEKMISTILKQLIAKGYLIEVQKGKKGAATVYEIQVNVITSGNQSVTNRYLIGNQCVTNDEPTPTVTDDTGNQSVTNRYLIGNQSVDTINKNSNKSKSKKEKTFLSDSNEYRLSKLLFNEMRINNPNCKEPNFETWSKNIDLMIRIDKRKIEDIERLIKWSQKDSFWKNNILSTSKLRDQFDALTLKSNGTNTSQREQRKVADF